MPSTRLLIASLLILASAFDVLAQDVAPLVESSDTHYYDFWVGRWAVVKEGAVDPAGPTFTVTRGVHAAAVEETCKDWYMFKEFEINGDRYLSRQGILRVDESRAVRISERSDDGGQTWTVRFREELQRIR